MGSTNKVTSFLALLLTSLLHLALGCSYEEPSVDFCIALTCDDAGANCGSISDACGGTIECGYCADGYVCGLTQPNACGYSGPGAANGSGNGFDNGADNGDHNGSGNGQSPNDDERLSSCRPIHCVEAGFECGSIRDGCGTELTCGFCGGGLSCGAGGKVGVCGISACARTSCQEEGAQCGQIPDGCGGIIDCGVCPSGQACGGGGSYTCGTLACTPSPDCSNSCGLVKDGCAGVSVCPPCPTEEICASGFCVDGLDSIGTVCNSNDDCISGYCLSEKEISWSGGYCTTACITDADCGTGNVCTYSHSDSGGVCVLACTTTADCRAGYVCALPEGSEVLACIPGGTGTGGPGSGCSTTANCAGGAQAICLTEGEGFAGGYCTESCKESSECPPGTACAFRSTGRGICVETCDDPIDCREDYRCRPLGAGITACWPGGNTGDHCLDHNDCLTDACLSQEPHGWNGGYCTKPCLTSSDCDPGDRCLPYGPSGHEVCTKSCSEDLDCRDGYVCRGEEREKSCVPYGGGSGHIGDPCIITSDCAGAEDAICVSTPGGGRCSIRCFTDSQCPDDHHCIIEDGAEAGFCAIREPPPDSCTQDKGCDSNEICINGPADNGCGLPCVSNADCPSNTRCSADPVFASTGFCREITNLGPGNGDNGAPCAHDSQCASSICITQDLTGWPGGYCASPCDTTNDCQRGTVCVSSPLAGNDICMSTCTNDRECRLGHLCTDVGREDKVCVPRSGGGGENERCRDSTDCSFGLICVSNEDGRRCAQPCNSDNPCDDFMACKPLGDALNTGACQPGLDHGCSTNSDCPGGQICGIDMTTATFDCVDESTGGIDWGFGSEVTFGPTKTGEACTQGPECELGSCFQEDNSGWADGYCSGHCSSNADCRSGSVCGLKRILEIKAGPGIGLTINDLTQVFGFDPMYGVTISTTGGASLMTRLLVQWLLKELYGGFEATIVFGHCLGSCSVDSECRSGYRCMQVDVDGSKACLPYAGSNSEVGDECKNIAECPGGAPGYCFLEKGGFPGGYCTINCSQEPDICPRGTRCVNYSDGVYACMKNSPCEDLGASCNSSQCEPDPSCWDWFEEDWRWRWDLCCDTGRYCDPLRPCPPSEDWECTAHQRGQRGFCSHCVEDDICRYDYACYSPDGGRGVCYPSAKGARNVGEPCTRLRDCAGGVDGTCLVEEENTDGSIDWQDGYCTRTCGSCPSGSVCVETVIGLKLCLHTCRPDSWWRSGRECREGYICHDRGWFRSSVCVSDPDFVD